MAGGWGSKKNGVKIGVFWDDISVTGSTAKITDPHVSIDRDVNIADTSNNLSVSGGSVTDDSWSNLNVSGSGEERVKTVSAQTVTLKYGSTVSWNFEASFSGISYAGGTLTASKSITFPSRPYTVPAAPTIGVVGRSSATSESTIVKWTNNSTGGTDTAAPYTNTYVERLVDSSTTWAKASGDLSSAITSWTDSGTQPGHRYQYRVRAKNSAGTSSASAVSAWIYTTPLPVSSPTVSKSGANIIVGWTPGTPYYTGTQIIPNRGGTDASAVTVASPTATWTDTAVNAGVTQYYKVRHYISSVPLSAGSTTTLYSATAQSDDVMLAGPPNSPVVTFTPTVFDAAVTASAVSWTHKPIDASAQTKYQYQHRYSTNAGASWSGYTTSSQIAGAASTVPFPAGTFVNERLYEIQVATWGQHATGSAYSAAVQFSTSLTPAVKITVPDDDPDEESLLFSNLSVTATFTDTGGATQPKTWEVILYAQDGTTRLWPEAGALATFPAEVPTTGLVNFQVPYSLADTGHYVVTVRAEDQAGLWSPLRTSPFVVNFADPPAAIVDDTDCDTVHGRTTVAFHLPPPGVGEAAATGATLQRLTHDNWVNVGDYTVGQVPGSPWVDETANLATNPSFESTSGTVEVWRNLAPTPNMEGTSGTTEVWRNLANNPGFETTSGTAETRRNLCTNPVLTTGTTGYVGQLGATVAQSTAEKHDGYNSIAVTCPGAAAAEGVAFPTAVASMSGKTYASGCWVKAAAGVQLYAVTRTAGGAGEDSVQVIWTGNGSWQWIGTTTKVAQADAVSTQLHVRTKVTAATTFWVTQALIEERPTSPIAADWFGGTVTPDNRRNECPTPQATAGWGTSPASGGAATTSLATDARWKGASAARKMVWTTAGTGLGYISCPGYGQMAVGETWVISMRVLVVGGLPPTLTVGGTNSPTCTMGAQQSIDNGDGTTTLWRTATCTSLGAGTGTFVIFTSINTPLIGHELWAGDATYECGVSTFNGYFDGSYTSQIGYTPTWYGTANNSVSWLRDTDLTAAWSGAADNSATTLTGAGVANASTNEQAPVSSTHWKARGTKSLRMIPTLATNASLCIVAGSAASMAGQGVTFVAGKTYTVSVRCRLIAPLTGTLDARSRTIGYFANSGGGNVLVAQSAIAPNAAGETDISLTFTVPAAATSSYLILWNGASKGGGDVWWDNLLIVEGNYPGTYFDGATPARRDNRATVPVPTGVGGNNGFHTNNAALYPTTYDPTGGRRPGTPATKQVRTTSTPNSSIASYNSVGCTTWSVAARLPVTAGEPLIGSAYVKCSVPARGQLTFYFFDANNAQIGPTLLQTLVNLPTDGSYMRLSHTVTVPAGATNMGMMVAVNTLTGSIVGGESAWVCDALVEYGSTLKEWFDGSNPPADTPNFTTTWTGTAGASASYVIDPDLTTAWAGTAHASATTVTGAAVLNVTAATPALKPISSTQWAAHGTKSLRMIPVSSSNYTYVGIGGDAGGMRLGMVAGKTYTALATFRLTAPQTGTLYAGARCVEFVHKDSGGTYVFAQSTQPPNAAGTTQIRYTFTVPVGATEAFVRVSNGAAAGGGDVWVDDFALVEGTYTGTYFDGSVQSPVRVNAATNPCPVDTTGWYSNQGALSVPTYDATGGRRAGTGAKRFTRSATSPSTTIATAYAIGITDWSPATRVPVVPGEVWTVSSYSKANVPFWTTLTVLFYNGDTIVGGLLSSATVNGAASEWVRPYVTVTVPAGATNFAVSDQAIYRQTGNTVGTEIGWMADALYEKVGTLKEWFDGSNPPADTPGYTTAWTGAVGASTSYVYDPDLTPSWTGTANNSPSILTGAGVASMGYVDQAAAISSTIWKRSGARSLRLVPKTSSTSSYAVIAGSANGMTGSGVTFVAGRTYTALATLRLAAPQAGVLWSRARLIYVFANSAPGGEPVEIAMSATPPNVAGEHEVRVTFTIPPGADKAYVNLTNGASMGNGDVWWENLALVEGTYEGPWMETSGVIITDPIPPLGEPVTYRLLTESAVPSIREGDPFVVDCSIPLQDCSYPEGMRILLDGGPNWSQQVTIIGSPAVATSVGREKILVTPVGRVYPIELLGPALPETYGLSGVVARDTFIQTYRTYLGSTRDEWEAMAPLPAPLCYRDPFGKRVFVSIGDVQTNWSESPLTDVSATLTRVTGGDVA